MGMKPRLNDGPQPMGVGVLATQPKKVGEDAPMPSNLATQRKNIPGKELKGTEKPS